ncbi:unnamed protein product [Lymnaea stagnalis]|uniref:Noggin n=1 Tax=Lymnaea stagnalis TaxID=6523 RepID=A0AAV2IHB0_LYMST
MLKPEEDLKVNGGEGRKSTSPEFLPINLRENIDPGGKDVTKTDAKQLQKQLGRSFERDYMSITDPSLSSSQPAIQFINGRPKGQRPSFLKLLRGARLQDGTKIKLRIDERSRKKVQNYIWALTLCPVVHTWRNLGPQYWPRWIKEARCSTKVSCSIPKGMTCAPSAKTFKTILRWHCGDPRSKLNCSWITINYPVITACSCGC